ncbi:MAG: bifunctional UDP-sugar hydrolase/5'-nucleotidase [Chloroflexota bacterium]
MELIILHSNDTHGHLTPLPTANGSSLGGYARRATFVAQQRAAHPHVLLLDAGDFYQGSRYWHAFQGEPDIELMNQLGYDAASLGNHDFDGGLDLLAKRLTEANFPILCANMAVEPSDTLAQKWQSYTIKQFAGVRVAIFSLLVEHLQLFPPEFAQRMERHPVAATAQPLVAQLRQTADFVILLSHLGHDDDVALAQNIDGLDLIIGGHTHTPLNEILWVNDTPVVRGIVGTQTMGRVAVQFAPDKKPVVQAYEQVPLDDSFAADEGITAVLNRWQAKLPPEKIIGHLTTPIDTCHESKTLGESAAGNFYTDALNAFAGETAVLAFAHMGTLRGDRIFGAGPFTDQDLAEFHPFPNRPLARVLTAVQLKQLLEQGVSQLPHATNAFLSWSGLTVTIDTRRQPQQIDLANETILQHGERVVSIQYQNQLLDLSDSSQTFPTIFDGYMGRGGAGYFFLRQSPLLRQFETLGTAVLKWYLQHHAPVVPRVEGRLQYKGIQRV